jgi:hypothetical protein
MIEICLALLGFCIIVGTFGLELVGGDKSVYVCITVVVCLVRLKTVPSNITKRDTHGKNLKNNTGNKLPI